MPTLSREEAGQLIDVLKKLIDDGKGLAEDLRIRHKTLELMAKHCSPGLPEVAARTFQFTEQVLGQYHELGKQLERFIRTSIIHNN